MRIFQNKERGAAVVEFALVVPLLLLILFGIIEFGILFYDKAVITNASREAARQWIVYRDNSVGNPLLSEDDLQAIVDNYTQQRLISLGGNPAPDVETNPSEGSSSTPIDIESGDTLTLTVTYDYNFLFLPGFMQSLGPTIQLDAQTVMVAE